MIRSVDRLWKEVNGVRTYFVYADEGLVAEVDAAGNVTKSYGYRPGSTWTTDPLFMKVGGQYYFYQNDHLGTPQKLTAVNGASVWSAKYSSFGKADIDPSSTITNNLRFPGQYFDQETGLHYNWHRYYHPKTGRYLRTDPSHQNQPKGSNIPYYLYYLLNSPEDLNVYSYVGNNPANFKDPMGLFKECGLCEEKVINSDKLIECLGKRGPTILIFGTACAVAILTPAPLIAKIPAIIGTCGITALLVADCIIRAYECKRIAGKKG